MADESIGSVSVNIVGDYSGLEKSFNEAQNLAQQAGASISAGLEAGAAGANDLTAAAELTDEGIQALFADGMKAAEAWSAFGITAEQAAAATEALGGQAQAAATGFTAVANAAGSAIPPVEGAGAAIASAGNSAEASGVQVDGLISKMYALMALRAFVRLGEDAIEAFGKIQQLQTSLDLLGAGAKGAVAEVQMLKDLSIQLAVPFDQIAESGRKLSASFGTGENLTAVMIAAGNAAQATGQSFQTVTAALERVNDTGAITGRQLLALHISWQQMAQSMGVSIDEAKAKLKAGGQSAQQDVSDLLDVINKKYAEAADAQAKTLLGQITILRNEVAFALAQIGEDLGPVIPLIGKSVLVLISGFEVVLFDLKIVIDRVVQFGMTAVSVLQTVGKVAGDIAKGNVIMAAADVANGIVAIKDISAHASAEMLADANKLSSSLEAIWGNTAKKITASFTPSGGGDDAALKATRDKVKGLQDLTSMTAVWIEQEKLEVAAQRAVTVETAKFNEEMGYSLNDFDYMARKTALATEGMYKFGDAVEPVDSHLGDLEKETNKLSGTMNKLGAEVQAVGQQALDTTPWGKMDAALKTLGLSVDDMATKSRMAKVAAAEFIAANTNDIPKATAAWEVLNAEIGRVAKVNLPEAIKLQEEQVASAARLHAPVLQQIADQEKLLQLRIQNNTQQGKSSNAEIIALTNLNLKTQALATQTNFLGNAYKSLMGDVDQAFTTLGTNIAAGIMQGENFWQTWHKTLNSIEQQLLTTVINAILKMAEAWLVNLVLGVAANKTAGTAEIATDAAIGGAAAAASTAAIPIIGPALAIPAGLGMYASILSTFIPLAIAGFSQGGMVPEDMFAMVHKGEYVLPAEKAAQAMLGGGPSPNGETHVHFDFSGAHFSNGMTDNQVKSVFDRAFRMSKLAGALPAGRFPQ
jgi:hypothetical protein